MKKIMRLLFVQGGTRVKKDQEGKWYSDTNFNNSIWERYKSYCDELVILLRREEKIYTPEEAQKKFNPIDMSIASLVTIADLYRPLKNTINVPLHIETNRIIEEEVKKADRVIVRSVNNYYTITTLKAAIKHNKPYLIEVAGACWEGFWYHSFKGKLVANKRERDCKRFLAAAPYAVYVTEDALQKRYPCPGKTLGCSDVELQPLIENDIIERLSRISDKKPEDKITIGTAAALDVKWKGQETVLRAIKKLRDEGVTNIEYHLIGAGNKDSLQSVIEKYNLSDSVKIIGTLPHDQVSHWLRSLDAYIQPSYQEGLCRSIVEALSVACPVICSDVGGNYELVPADNLFEKGNVDQIAEMIKKLSNKEFLIDSAQRGFDRAKDFEKKVLDEKRNCFYQDFCGN